MITASIWLTKLLLAHLLTDFILQPARWVGDKNERHFRSVKLYLHGIITALVACLFIGWQYWITGLVILATHIIIDGWKSYRAQTISYFLTDQCLHFAVIAGCWYFTFMQWSDVTAAWKLWNADSNAWVITTAVIFLTVPAGILIGQCTQQWRDRISDAEGLANAGKWIGIAERIIVFILVLNNQYSAIGLLITAKGIIRFNEKDRPEVKTEYLVIGTLLSIGIAIVTGLLAKW